MHPAPSIIFFTTASGAGYGLLFLVAAGAALGLIPAERWLGFVGLALSLGLITLGLLASTFHLGHPERAWRAVSQWRSSWLSREGVASLLTYVPAVIFAIGWVFLEDTGGLFAFGALLAALGAAITVYCTGMIYASLKPIRAWRHPLVPWLYMVFALMSGALLGHAVLAGFGVERVWIGLTAVLAALVGFALKVLYWRDIDRATPESTPETATGLGSLGRVSQLEPPHTQTNYLLDEMGYRIARKHARKLRQLCLGLGLAGGVVLTALALVASGALATLLASLAVLCGLPALAIERWLFFAEARHTVTLYYGRRAAAAA